MRYIFYWILVSATSTLADKFSDNLYQLFAKDFRNENLLVSPFSVSGVLAMCYMAAEGESAKKLKTLLGFSEDKIKVAEKYQKWLGKVKMDYQVNYEGSRPLSPNYESLVKEYFKADSNIVPNRTEPVIKITTYWKFHDRIIKRILPKEISKALFKNNITLTDPWQYEFDAKNTKQADFKISENKTVPVQMMHQRNVFRAAYFSDLQATVVELPFHSRQMSLLLFLPNKVDGLWEMEKKISDFSEPLNTAEAILALPKLRYGWRLRISERLEELGLGPLFTNEADFNLFGNLSSKLGDIFQNVFLELKEKGAQSVPPSSQKDTPRSAPVVFSFNRPFAFLIKDESTTYFQGHVIDPSKINQVNME
ncbi:serine protease inhibitor 42Dd-like [Drosophila bipectinata]|uniref:serine protease inhibitor 42Dd-like n=1 Tax=Drosophila bipectinata TaxID=42026 RepID=UPI0038B2CCA0